MELWAIVPELTLAVAFLALLVLAPFLDGAKSMCVYLIALSSLGAAALFYLLAYLFMNLGAFFVAARLEPTCGSELHGYRGLFRRAPGVALGFTILLLSLAGVPPMSGYIAKVLLLEAALSAGASWLAIIFAANIVLAAYYYLRVIAAMYLERSAAPQPLRSSRWLDTSVALSVAATLVLGILPEPWLGWVASAWHAR